MSKLYHFTVWTLWDGKETQKIYEGDHEWMSDAMNAAALTHRGLYRAVVNALSYANEADWSYLIVLRGEGRSVWCGNTDHEFYEKADRDAAKRAEVRS